MSVNPTDEYLNKLKLALENQYQQETDLQFLCWLDNLLYEVYHEGYMERASCENCD